MDALLRATARAEARHFWFRGFRAFVKPLVRRAIGGSRAVRILDCGCGTGANVEWLSRFGRAYGFDLSETGLRVGPVSGKFCNRSGSAASSLSTAASLRRSSMRTFSAPASLRCESRAIFTGTP